MTSERDWCLVLISSDLLVRILKERLKCNFVVVDACVTDRKHLVHQYQALSGF